VWYALAVVIVYREKRAGVVAYARWRDSSLAQRTQRIGVAWVERYGKGWRNRRGKRPEGALTIEQAGARAQRLVAEQEQKLARIEEDANASTFAVVADAWLSHGGTVARWSAATVNDRRYTLDHHLLPAFGATPVREITQAQVRRWWRSLHDPRREGGPLSDRNANKVLTELRAILNYAAADYGLATNPADGIAKHRERTDTAAPFYSVEQVEALARAAASERDALLFKVAAFAGLRRGELISLRWRCIDFTRCSITVDESVSAGIDSKPKHGKHRTLPLAPQLAQLLAAWQPDDAEDSDLVFPSPLDGGKLDGSALRRRYCAARDRAGLPPLRFHDLRHTFGSLAVDGGASLVQVGAWLGHSDLRTTARYLHTKSRESDAALLGHAFTGTAERVQGDLLAG
jgi:integrase